MEYSERSTTNEKERSRTQHQTERYQTKGNVTVAKCCRNLISALGFLWCEFKNEVAITGNLFYFFLDLQKNCYEEQISNKKQPAPNYPKQEHFKPLLQGI